MDSFSHPDRVDALAFSSDGTRLATASEDGTIRVWDTAGIKISISPTVYPKDLEKMDLSRVKWTVYPLTDPKEVLIRSESEEGLLQPRHHPEVYALTFNTNGTRLACADEDRTVRVWDTTSGKEVHRFSHDDRVYALAFSPDGTRLATASEDGTIRVWDTSKVSNSKAPMEELVPYEERLSWYRSYHPAVYALAFSPDGTRLASASEDGTARVYALHIEDQMTLALARITRTMKDDECEQYLPKKECPSKGPLVVADQVSRARKELRDGNVEKAVPSFRKIQQETQSPFHTLDFNSIAATVLVEEGIHLLRENKVEDAFSAYKEAEKLKSEYISADFWNHNCWKIILKDINLKNEKYADDVMYACEQAVKLSNKYGEFCDSRGVARALIENLKGAMEDFECFVEWGGASKERISQRQAWIRDLKKCEEESEKCKNPINKKTLEELNYE